MENKASENLIKRAGLPRPTLFAASGLVLLAAIGLWAVDLAAVFLPSEEPMDLMLGVNLLYYLPFVLLPAIICGIRKHGMSDALRLNPMPVFPVLSVAMMALVSTLLTGIVTAGWSWLLNLFGFSSDVGTIIPESSSELLRLVVIVAALPAVCEELLFRGFVLSAWEPRGTKYAIIASSLLFALIHGNIYGLPAYILVGCVSGYLVFALDSVYAGMIYHTVYNTACLVINYMTFSQPVAGEAAAAGADALTLVLSVALELIAGGFMVAMTLFMLKMRRRLMGIEPFPRNRIPLTNEERAMIVLSIIPMVAMILLT